jgi:hypothetical protein
VKIATAYFIAKRDLSLANHKPIIHLLDVISHMKKEPELKQSYVGKVAARSFVL